MCGYIDYDEICGSEWVFCDEKGCNDCQYAYGDRGCKVSDWIDSLPRYEMSMKKKVQAQFVNINECIGTTLIVRCKNCEYCEVSENTGVSFCCKFEFMNEPDDYCSYGERSSDV